MPSSAMENRAVTAPAANLDKFKEGSSAGPELAFDRLYAGLPDKV